MPSDADFRVPSTVFTGNFKSQKSTHRGTGPTYTLHARQLIPPLVEELIPPALHGPSSPRSAVGPGALAMALARCCATLTALEVANGAERGR